MAKLKFTVEIDVETSATLSKDQLFTELLMAETRANSTSKLRFHFKVNDNIVKVLNGTEAHNTE